MPDSLPPARPPQPVLARALTAALLLVCAAVAFPLLSGLTWGVAFAVVFRPVQKWLARLTSRPALAAAVSTSLVALLLVVPVVLVAAQFAAEARELRGRAEELRGDWRERLGEVPRVGPWLQSQAEGVEPRQLAGQLLERAGGLLAPVAGGLGAFAFQSLVAAFVLFFCLKDGPDLLAQLRDLLPVAPDEAVRLTVRAEDAIQATLKGTILTGVAQGVSGGVVFALLGIPGAVLWGVVMTVLSVLPVLGAFIVWVPAAGYLAAQGSLGSAAILTVWGVVMAGPVCNWIYARAAGDRMKLHPLATLLSFVGGLAVFGVAGMVLGPVAFAVASELPRAWRAGRPDGVLAPEVLTR